jgi:hypothetical protein
MDPASRQIRTTTARDAKRSALSQRLLDSYRHWLGTELIPREGTAQQQAAALFAAPFVVVSHGTEPDPILNYANQWALDLWEMDLATFLQTPSRMTAEPMHRDERARLLERTARDGFVDDYRGIRVSRTGRRFLIERATVWNLLDEQGNYAGQAATLSSWHELTGPPPTEIGRHRETT